MTTVLTPIRAADYAVALFLAGLQAQSQAAFQRQANALAADAAQETGAAQSAIAARQDLADQADDARDVLGDLVRRAHFIRDRLDDAKAQAWKSQAGTDDSAFTYALAFNAAINSLIDQAEDSGDSPNLLGAQPQDTYTFYTGLNRATRSVSRTYLGTDYVLDVSDGTSWVRDRGYAPLLRELDANGDYTGEIASVSGGVQLDSLSGTDITFTVAPETADARTLSGTLSRDGLEVLDAWLYDGLTTDDGRSRAQDDLNAAKVIVDIAIAGFEAAQVRAQYVADRAGEDISALNGTLGDITTRQALALQELQSQSDVKLALVTSAVENAAALRAEYTKLFGGADTAQGAFTQSLIDISV
ncbi:MAG: hypothetical protein KDE22_14320 [Rhodobacterales bacterium]|nr:hypothetical protein [Rhodobacterales bacterium]